ncbi:putative cell surface protein [Weissella oryzae SG25]|uniref:Putative cell surface protein n=1 Tax=Weissella oryzae (strain DSM 25784 / JCM 18191 / LMG 30913 / SG25) TaxID=1329250 RepID=A0A069D133_WEIOS|nr:isopeptide-forming domain-containing fimbrial protein [Weissella oryzae]GAK31071.1 putative cell surface protein [Weissella oryzae SG25]
MNKDSKAMQVINALQVGSQKTVVLFSTALILAGTGLSASRIFAEDTTNKDTDTTAKKGDNGISINVGNDDLKAAAKEAQDAGLKVTEKATKYQTVTEKDADETQKKVAADNAAQAKSIREKVAKYKADKAQYDKDKAAYDKGNSAIPNQDNANDSGLNTEGGVSKNGDWRYMLTGSRDDVRNSKLTIVASKNLSAAVAEHQYLKKGTILRWNDNTQMTQEQGKTSSMFDGSVYDKGGSVVLTNVGTLQDGTNVNMKLSSDQSFLVAPHEPNQDNNGRSGKIIADSLDDAYITYQFIDDKGNPLKIWHGLFLSDIDEPVSGYIQNVDLSKAQQNGIAVVDNGLNVDKYDLVRKQSGDNTDSNKDSVMAVEYGSHNTIHVYNSGSTKSNGYGDKQRHMITPLFGQELDVTVLNPPAEITKPDIEYQTTELVEVPEVTKDVEAGEVNGDTDASINGKQVKKGDELSYPLAVKTALPANREDITSLIWKDKLPDGFEYKSAKAFDENSKDVSNYLKIEYKDGEFTATATDEYLKLINADKTKAFKVLTVDIYGTANKDGVTFNNTYGLSVNDKTFDSNEVSNSTPAAEQPAPAKDLPTTGTTNPIAKFFQKLFASF